MLGRDKDRKLPFALRKYVPVSAPAEQSGGTEGDWTWSPQAGGTEALLSRATYVGGGDTAPQRQE
jgi:hypothetical protein